MIEVKRLSGALNTDDKVQDVIANQHIDANNIRFTGGANGLTAENIRGNYLIDNNDLPAGTNSCIGAFFDQLNQKIIWFNYNSNGDNGIYEFNIATEVVTPIFICGINSATDILNFSLDYPISSVSIVYRDGGNLLYWTDALNSPKYLNIDPTSISTLSPFIETMITAAKVPPFRPIECVYNTDVNYNVNNFRNKYFRFSYRYVYENGEKSTFAPTSKLSVINTLYPNQIINFKDYNRIRLTYQSPDSGQIDFKQVEIYGQEFSAGIWGDFFLINTIDKSGALPYSDYFDWYNDGNYVPILPSESDLRYDRVPDSANALELLNGNIIIYGGIVEGYDAVKRQDVDVQIVSVNENVPSDGTNKNCTSWKWNERERFGIVYYDQFGKTNGVVSFLQDATIDSTNFDVNTTSFQGVSPSLIGVPKITATINNSAPSWSKWYQWVRVDAYPQFFLQWISNDFIDELPTDPNGFAYIGIQSLLDANANGLVPVYEWTPGDRVRVISNWTAPLTETALVTIYDYEILEVAAKPMTPLNPATPGAFLRIAKSAGSIAGYTQKMRIEIYTPTPKNDTIFYEWGQAGRITLNGGIYCHETTTIGGSSASQTPSNPCICEWSQTTSGSLTTPRWQAYTFLQFIRTLQSPQYPPALGIPVWNQSILLSRYVNQNTNSRTSANSRGWIIEADSKEEYLNASVRWGGAYSQDGTLNELNRFYPESIDTIDRSRGDIRRFKSRERILRVFQDRGVGQYGVYARYIQNNSGDGNLVTTNDIITTNNIQYYAGAYGLCGYSTNLVSSQKADYFTDVVTGRSIRLAQDGLTDLGLLYKGQYYLSSLVTDYNQQLSYYTAAGWVRSKVMGFYDFFDDQYNVILQGSTCNSYSVTKVAASILPSIVYYTDCNFVRQSHEVLQVGDTFNFCAIHDTVDIFTSGGGALTVTDNGPGVCGDDLEPYNFSFNERRNAFCSFYGYHPEWALGANDIVYTWKDGDLWKHNNTTDYCNFYGTQDDASVSVVMNNNLLTKKSWNSLNEIASDVWEVPEMYTNSYSYGTQPQQSNLVPAEFTILEGNPSTAIKRDVNSPGGKINGNFMKGNYLVLKLQKTSAQSLVTLSEISVRFTESPLTAK